MGGVMLFPIINDRKKAMKTGFRSGIREKLSFAMGFHENLCQDLLI